MNNWCGHWFLDHIVHLEENLGILNGGIVIGAYLWLWFEGNERRRTAQRGYIIAALIGAGTATLLARLLANFLPFRERPMYAGIGFHPPSIPIASDYVHWSSFPSDHAAIYFALAFGVLLLWRGLGWMLMVYSALWICLPRIYLGIHYPSDIVVGALVGVGTAWFARKAADSTLFTRWVKSPLLDLERQSPQLFYAVAFLANFELATMFQDLRLAAREAVVLLQLSPLKGAVLASGCALVATIAAIVIRRRLMLIAAGRRLITGTATDQAHLTAQSSPEIEAAEPPVPVLQKAFSLRPALEPLPVPVAQARPPVRTQR